MIVGVEVFTVALWGALTVVAGAALYLLVVLVIEWRNKTLW